MPYVNAQGLSLVRAILAPNLEPISFDDLPLGGEWTTRRRTISEAEIALFAAAAGDFSPLTIDATHASSRVAPPALLVAMAVGLGSVDMPVPAVAAWEWLNWKFPRPVHAGDTIYTRWTLTQKRAPVGGSRTAIVVWRVDVHTAGGALCAEGEVGASVLRKVAAAKPRLDEPAKARLDEPASGAAPTAPTARRRRRRRAPAGDGAKGPIDTKTAVAMDAPVVAAAAPATAERAAGSPRRRRRRRPSGSAQARNGDAPATAAPEGLSHPAAVAAAAGGRPHLPAPVPRAEPTSPTSGEDANPLTRVMRRLRRT